MPRGWGGLLDAAGDARFRARAAVFAALMAEQSADQCLYEGLMEALGYRANRQPFLKLAQSAPWQPLAEEALAGPPQERAEIVEGRLLKVSGLAAAAGNRKRRPPGFGPAMAADEWHTFRVRPANHPRHRMAGAARLLARFLASSPAGGRASLATALAEKVGGKPAGLTAALAVKGDDTGGPAFIGADRARDMAVNVALPFCHALSGDAEDSPCPGPVPEIPQAATQRNHPGNGGAPAAPGLGGAGCNRPPPAGPHLPAPAAGLAVNSLANRAALQFR